MGKIIEVTLNPSDRIPSKDIQDGQEFLWLEHPEPNSRHRILYRGTAVRCDQCNALGTVNALPVQNEEMLKGVKWTSKVPVEVGAYDDDGSGDCLCEECRALRPKKEA